MARITKMTVDEYIKNREDMTMLAVASSADGWEIILRIDGSYASEGEAVEQAKYVSKILGIPIATE